MLGTVLYIVGVTLLGLLPSLLIIQGATAVAVLMSGIPGGLLMYFGELERKREAAARAKEITTAAAARAKEITTAAAARLKAIAEAKANFERRRIELRDADCQDIPYEYQCIGHPNVTLALRYGIANTSRSSAGEGRSIRENTAIRLQKMEKVQEDEAGGIYLAELPDFGGRRVKVVIRPGTEFVQTFLPMFRTWFKEHEDLERLLKDNPTFTLKELATFHVQAVLNAKR